MISGIWSDSESFVFAVVHRNGSRRRDASIGSGCGRNGISVDGKTGTDGAICRYITKGIARNSTNTDAINEYIGNMISGIWSDSESFVFAVVHCYGSRRRDASVGFGCGRNGISIDGKTGTDGAICRYITKGIARNSTNTDAINEYIGNMISGIWADGEGFVFAVVHCYGSRRRDASVGSGCGRNGISIDGKTGTDGVIGGYIAKCITRYGSNACSIHEDIGNMISGIWSDSESFVFSLIHGDCARRSDTSISS